MNLPTLNDIHLQDKTILVRADLDGSSRLSLLIPLLKDLIESKAEQVILIGHHGRPKDKEPNLSLKPLSKFFGDSLDVSIEFLPEIPKSITSSAKIILLENLRYYPEEEKNDSEFANKLANLADVYVNEAFADSHREHASIVALPQAMLKRDKEIAFGPHFLSEIKHLDRALDNPAKPVITLLSGLKKDKLDYLDALVNISDQVFIAGRLPEYLDEDYSNPKVFVSRLMPDKEDITINSIENFTEAVKSAGTVIMSGVPGKFEDPGHRLSTERVFTALTKSEAFKLAGGGDTSKAIAELKYNEAFDWISSGGGAMLYYLTHRSLPAIEAARQR